MLFYLKVYKIYCQLNSNIESGRISDPGLTLTTTYFFTGINQIAKGHVSDPLLFYTVPTSPPDELKCELNTDKSLSFSWKLPRKGMKDSDGKVDINYHFSYWIEDVHDYKGMIFGAY